MAFPWSRSDAAAEALPGDRRRRAGGRRVRQEEARRESSRSTRERQHQRLAFTIGGGLVLVIVAILAYGVYQEFYKPPRVTAGSVNNVEFTMGDLVKRIRVVQGLTGRVDLGRRPFEVIQDLIYAEVLRQQAPLLGISVTGEHIDEALRAQFYPQAQPGQQVDPGQLDREYQERYTNYLERTNLSDQDYRVIVEEQLALGGLRQFLSLSIEDPHEQVEVEWIRLEPESSINFDEVMERLEIQAFDTVARDVGVPRFADSDGYVGWVPRKAFPDLDGTLYGDEDQDQEQLAVGETSDPVFTVDGIYIIRKLSGPEEQELSEIMRNKLSTELVLEWQRQQHARGAAAGWIKILNFDSKWYAWVADQVKISAPDPPQGQEGR